MQMYYRYNQNLEIEKKSNRSHSKVKSIRQTHIDNKVNKNIKMDKK